MLKNQITLYLRPVKIDKNLDLDFSINDTKIDRVNESLFLGVINRKPHVQNLTRKISKSLGIIYKSSFCLNENSLLDYYNNRL